MNKAIQQAYYMKIVYHNAGKALMAENYNYYKKLINSRCVKDIFNKVINNGNFATFSFTDRAGCAEDELFKYTADRYCDKNNVFIYEDDHFDKGKPMAVYVSGENIFLFSDYEYKFRNIHNIKLNKCYYRQDRNRYSARKLRSMAREYFEKSEYIAKRGCL